jgi:hypothetical protein
MGLPTWQPLELRNFLLMLPELPSHRMQERLALARRQVPPSRLPRPLRRLHRRPTSATSAAATSTKVSSVAGFTKPPPPSNRNAHHE